MPWLPMRSLAQRQALMFWKSGARRAQPGVSQVERPIHARVKPDSANRTRELPVPLSFHGTGRYAAPIWKEASATGADPNRLDSETLDLSAADTLHLRLALDGGVVAQLAPRRN